MRQHFTVAAVGPARAALAAARLSRAARFGCTALSLWPAHFARAAHFHSHRPSSTL